LGESRVVLSTNLFVRLLEGAGNYKKPVVVPTALDRQFENLAAASPLNNLLPVFLQLRRRHPESVRDTEWIRNPQSGPHNGPAGFSVFFFKSNKILNFRQKKTVSGSKSKKF
jgi:hypothetical protein